MFRRAFSSEKEIKKYLTKEINNAGIPSYVSQTGEVYYDDTEKHVLIEGNPRMGKTQCIALPFVQSAALAKQNLLMLDTNIHNYQIMKENFSGYDTYLFDFSNPYNSENSSFNIFLLLKKLFLSDDANDQDLGQKILENFLMAIICESDGSQKFWDNSGRKLLKGIALALIEVVKDESLINFKTFYNIFLDITKKEHIGGRELGRLLCDFLDNESMAKIALNGIVNNTASETRAGQISSADVPLERLATSKGIIEMLSGDKCFLTDLELGLDAKPFFIYICIPSSTSMYNTIIGSLTSIIMTYILEQSINFKGNHLPRRVNMLIDELGTCVAPAFPDLPKYVAAVRQNNIRIVGIVQNEQQLYDAYGENTAEALIGCFGMIVAFGTNNERGIQKYIYRVGKVDNSGILEDKLSPRAIYGMEPGRALILSENLCYFTKLLFFYESNKNEINYKIKNVIKEAKFLSLDEIVKSLKTDDKSKDNTNSFSNQNRNDNILEEHLNPFHNFNYRIREMDIDSLMNDIDKRLKELDEEEKRIKEIDSEQDKNNQYFTTKTLSDNGDGYKVGIKTYNQEKIKEVLEYLSTFPTINNIGEACEIIGQLKGNNRIILGGFNSEEAAIKCVDEGRRTGLLPDILVFYSAEDYYLDLDWEAEDEIIEIDENSPLSHRNIKEDIDENLKYMIALSFFNEEKINELADFCHQNIPSMKKNSLDGLIELVKNAIKDDRIIIGYGFESKKDAEKISKYASKNNYFKSIIFTDKTKKSFSKDDFYNETNDD